jgi:hypothetical protein
LEFFRTGKFDYLKLGQTKEWIINNFPDPNGMNTNTYESQIWVYGNIELHFNDDETLYLIYSDYIDTLDGGDFLHLNKWILNEPEKLTLEYVIHYLNRERIGFKIEHDTLSQGFGSSVIEILVSKVSLGFAPIEGDQENIEDYLIRCRTEDSNQSILASFSLMNK